MLNQHIGNGNDMDIASVVQWIYYHHTCTCWVIVRRFYQQLAAAWQSQYSTWSWLWWFSSLYSRVAFGSRDCPYTLLCSLDPRRPIKATQTRQSSKRGHRLLMRIRHRIMNFPHRKKFLSPCECRWTVVVQPICQHSSLSYSVALLPFAAIVRFGYKLSKITLMMSPFFVSCRKLLQLVCETAPHVGYDMYLVNPDGSHQSRDLVALCRGSAPFPSSGVHVFIRAKNALVSSSTSDDPQLVNIDCTGLGGHDLAGFKDYDICIRTDKHGQSIYGPSVTPLESPGRDGVHHVSLVALGGSKAMHEFLVLHYMATDSAEEWDTFLDLCLPQCTWVRAGSQRALAMHMYNKCHVAPSHRRLAHPSWIAGMKMMLDLLLGARQNRYLRSRPFDHLPAQVYVRGFLGGSYSGICLLHLLWNMPHVQVGGILGGIALPLTWDPARPWYPAHGDPPHYWQIVSMASSWWHIALPSVQILHCGS